MFEWHFKWSVHNLRPSSKYVHWCKMNSKTKHHYAYVHSWKSSHKSPFTSAFNISTCISSLIYMYGSISSIKNQDQKNIVEKSHTYISSFLLQVDKWHKKLENWYTQEAPTISENCSSSSKQFKTSFFICNALFAAGTSSTATSFACLQIQLLKARNTQM